ncbi:hypothetical protein [Armatimonas rosea]|uniref:SMI1/KNR4 family protein n=1 Tax=Armatimonas rosea TaxID=685828 RepID=A0A7W9W7E5_ARMRO|nr:hypothetical protein [Armatimonas rosea]MBB6051573.1 hypothetical protein [Armatimonas rosea]
MSVLELTKELKYQLLQAHPGLEQRLRPGLPPRDAVALAARYGVTLTDEALDFFSVLNGFYDPYAEPQQETHLYQGRFLESLEDALEHYHELWRRGEDKEEQALIFNAYQGEFFLFDSQALPPLRFLGEDSLFFYAFDLRGEGKPVWDMDDLSGLSVVFENLEAMLRTLTTLLAEGVLLFDQGEWGIEDSRAEREIMERCNSKSGD